MRVITRSKPRPPPPPASGAPRPDDAGKIVRIVLPLLDGRVSASADFDWYDDRGATLLARANRGDKWRLERERPGVRIRARAPDGTYTPWHRGLVVRPTTGYLTLGGKRYRGEFFVLPVDSTLMVINRLRVEDYLRGVVPLEIGKLGTADSSAMQAQAVAARSYAYVRLSDPTPRAYDLRPTTIDQVYGGVGAETDVGNDAIDATRGLVIQWQGRAVDAPFFSTCGGTTADAAEIWNGPALPYLRRVSDQVPGTARFYCDKAARYRWSRTLSAGQINAALAEYLGQYARGGAAGPGHAKSIAVRNRGPSGRVTLIDIETDRASFPIRGDDIRSVLRAPGGEPLHSTYFSVAAEHGGNGLISSVTLRGQGYGHGVGMCQWGAIGRARAGQSFRTILSTYYPGTTVGPVE